MPYKLHSFSSCFVHSSILRIDTTVRAWSLKSLMLRATYVSRAASQIKCCSMTPPPLKLVSSIPTTPVGVCQLFLRFHKVVSNSTSEWLLFRITSFSNVRDCFASRPCFGLGVVFVSIPKLFDYFKYLFRSPNLCKPQLRIIL